jgi:hypothetical protein
LVFLAAAAVAASKEDPDDCMGADTLKEGEKCPTWEVSLAHTTAALPRRIRHLPHSSSAKTHSLQEQHSHQTPPPPTRNKWARGDMVHEPPVPMARQMPRISVAELELPENFLYRERRRPFILTGAMDDWPGPKKWKIQMKGKKGIGKKTPYLAKMFKKSVTDMYPYNMLKSGTHPFLYRFGAGLRQVLEPPGRFHEPANEQHPYSCDDGCRYIHLQLTRPQWRQLEEAGDLPVKRHPHTGGDNWWQRRCLDEVDVNDEYHIKTHWKIILIGSRGAGMFNHTDSLQTSSWHAHVQGKKWWYVCGTNRGKGHGEGKTECFESILMPGEILYYGRQWYHQTQNLRTPTTTITGTVVHANNFEYVAAKLHGECYRSEMNFNFSGKLCDALDKCYSLWHQRFRGKAKPDSLWRPWREIASDSIIAEKDKVKPTESNYDGRNYIGEEYP